VGLAPSPPAAGGRCVSAVGAMGGTIALGSPGISPPSTVSSPAARDTCAPLSGGKQEPRSMLLSKHHPEPRVLLIEDTEDTRELSRMALESQACEVVAVSSAEAALGLLQAGERFDLVFTDVCLGEVSGIEAAHRVKQEQPGLPVLVTSGLEPSVVVPQLGPGMHFLPKPYTMSELLDAIRACFQHPLAACA